MGGLTKALLASVAAAALTCAIPGCGSDGTAPDRTTSGLLETCAADCSAIAAPPCQVSACDTSTGKCVFTALDGPTCDDGLFCTVNDTCHAGVCTGDANDCGLSAIACKAVACNETTHACRYEQQADGYFCDTGAVCAVGGACQGGLCVAIPKTCHFEAAPDECHVASCNATTGACDVFQPANEGLPCHSDPCVTNAVCQDGTCKGDPRDCSGYADACNTASCDATHGGCFRTPVAAGAACATGDPCNGGKCNATGICSLTPKNEGVSCHNNAVACGTKDACRSGVCEATTSQTVFFQDSFASNARGWTLEGAWGIGGARGISSFPYTECKPTTDHTGSPDNGIATTGIGGRDGDAAHDFQYLTSPAVDTSGAPKVVLVFSEMSGVPAAPYARAVAEVYDGASWINVWEHTGNQNGCYDADGFEVIWTTVTVDVTAHKNPAMKVRFGTSYAIANPTSGLSIDDVALLSAACP